MKFKRFLKEHTISEKLNFNNKYTDFVREKFKLGIEIETYIDLKSNSTFKANVKNESKDLGKELTIKEMFKKIIDYTKKGDEFKFFNFYFNPLYIALETNKSPNYIKEEPVLKEIFKVNEADGLRLQDTLSIIRYIQNNEIYQKKGYTKVGVDLINKILEIFNEFMLTNDYTTNYPFGSEDHQLGKEESQQRNNFLIKILLKEESSSVSLSMALGKIKIILNQDPKLNYENVNGYIEMMEKLLKKEFPEFVDKCEYDGSLKSKIPNKTPIEIISGVLDYDLFFRETPRILEYLKTKFNAHYDTTTGLHISFSSPEINKMSEINWLKVAVLGGSEDEAKKFNRQENRNAMSFLEFFKNLNKLKDDTHKRLLDMVNYIANKGITKESLYYVRKLEQAYFIASGVKDSWYEKYLAFNLKDFKKSKGRVEFRVYGNKAADNWDKVADGMNNILNAVYIGNRKNKVYEKEYLDQLVKYIKEIKSKYSMLPRERK